MEKRWSVLPALAGAWLLVSCYPGEVTNVAELDIVVTTHDDTVTFTSFTTYALLDSVVHIDLEDATNDSLLNRDNDALILAEVRAGIEAMGYVEEMDPANTTPDVLLLVGALGVVKDAYFTYGWWGWYGWYPYYPCCYGPGYGLGYPAGVGSFTYAVGTLVITMLDPTRPGNNVNEAPILWVAGINGLLEGSTLELSTRITNLIGQAFGQSPYLSAN